MWGWVIRGGSIAAAAAATAAFGYSFLLATFYCYGQNVGCGKGWIARTVVTGGYLLIVAGIILVTRWLLRLVAERTAKRRAGMM